MDRHSDESGRVQRQSFRNRESCCSGVQLMSSYTKYNHCLKQHSNPGINAATLPAAAVIIFQVQKSHSIR